LEKNSFICPSLLCSNEPFSKSFMSICISSKLYLIVSSFFIFISRSTRKDIIYNSFSSSYWQILLYFYW
jgi:hypothetical protein